MSMDLQLRPAADTDREFLYRLHCSTMRTVIERTWGWDEAWQLSDFDRRIAEYQVFVIEDGEEPIGGLMLNDTPESIDIVELQIVPEHQRKGIGTRVLRRVIDDADRRTLSVTLSVVPANWRARRLYERLGFHETGIDEPFIRMRFSTGDRSPRSY